MNKSDRIIFVRTNSNLLRLVSVIVAVIVCFSFIQVQTVSAASKKSKALKAYKKVLSKKSIKWDGQKVSLKHTRFGLAYVDKDKVPELFVDSWGNTCHAQGYFALYKYKKGKVVFVRAMDDIKVYPKKSFVDFIHSGTGGYEHYYTIISGTKAKNYIHHTVYPSGTGTKLYYAKFKSPTSYNETKISKKKFNSLLKKKVGKTKAKKIKYYKNTAANRKKRLK